LSRDVSVSFLQALEEEVVVEAVDPEAKQIYILNPSVSAPDDHLALDGHSKNV
jgi:hypothetical protein